MQNHQIIFPCNLMEFEREVLDTKGNLKILPFSFYQEQPWNTIAYFMHQYGYYVLPTQELIDYLFDKVIRNSNNAIEIGCGNGAIGRALGIPITDNKMQALPHVAELYKAAGQPAIKYPSDVEHLDYLAAIKKYNPSLIIGAFITHKFDAKTQTGNALGVREEDFLHNRNYIHIGNRVTHKNKPALKIPHEEIYYEWIITRAADQKENRIYYYG